MLRKQPAASKEQPKNWYKDRYERVRVMRNFLAVLTIVSLIISLVAVSTVLHLAPLKSVDPFVIQIDDKTGFTQVINPLTTAEYTAKESVNAYFAVKYLRARESYDYALLAEQRDVVRVMSSPQEVWGQYLSQTSMDNKDSAPARLGTVGIRDIKIRSINVDSDPRTGDGTANIRFTIEERMDDRVQTFNRLAVMSFSYKEIALRAEDRYINPLGFLVTKYRVTEDDVQQ